MNVEARLRNQFEDAEAIPFPEGWRSLLINDCLGELDPGVEIKNIGLAGCGGGLSVRLDHETISGGRHAVCEAAVIGSRRTAGWLARPAARWENSAGRAFRAGGIDEARRALARCALRAVVALPTEPPPIVAPWTASGASTGRASPRRANC